MPTRERRYETLRCTVKHRKAFPPAFALDPTDPDYMREDAIYTWDHRWSDHAGGLKGGCCEKCGLTLKQCRVRVDPRTGEPVTRSRVSLARAIAMTPADVPPVHWRSP